MLMTLQAVERPLFPNPKRQSGKQKEFYSYYAGYSADFVRGVLEHLALEREAAILDPWNGSGTTSHVAHCLGYDVFGYDINPAIVTVAKARNLDPGVKESLDSLAAELTSAARTKFAPLVADDPLRAWLSPRAAAALRGLQRSISELLVDGDDFVSAPERVSCLSDLAAFFLLSLFRTARSLIQPYVGSNPTWIKIPKNVEDRLDVEPECVFATFLNHLHLQKLHLVRRCNRERDGRCAIEVGSSLALPLQRESIDAAITSPPYCTRIDYGVATLPELAVLNFPIKSDFRKLRASMIGAPLIVGDELDVDPTWGKTCVRLLREVEDHDAKASETYYLRNLTQYFDGIFASLCEIDRVLKAHGTCTVVVQDSYYKDIHIDLAQIFQEMGGSIGWIVADRVDYPKATVMGRINPKTRPYRANFRATESVVVFRRLGIGK